MSAVSQQVKSQLTGILSLCEAKHNHLLFKMQSSYKIHRLFHTANSKFEQVHAEHSNYCNFFYFVIAATLVLGILQSRRGYVEGQIKPADQRITQLPP